MDSPYFLATWSSLLAAMTGMAKKPKPTVISEPELDIVDVPVASEADSLAEKTR